MGQDIQNLLLEGWLYQEFIVKNAKGETGVSVFVKAKRCGKEYYSNNLDKWKRIIQK